MNATDNLLGHGDPLLMDAMKRWKISDQEEEDQEYVTILNKNEKDHVTKVQGDPLFQEVLAHDAAMKRPLHLSGTHLGHGDPLFDSSTLTKAHSLPDVAKGGKKNDMFKDRDPVKAFHGDPLLDAEMKPHYFNSHKHKKKDHEHPKSEHEQEPNYLFDRLFWFFDDMAPLKKK